MALGQIIGLGILLGHGWAEQMTPGRGYAERQSRTGFAMGRPPMLDRQYGMIVFECDSCNEVLKTETRDFDDARLIMKANEWKAQKIGGRVDSCVPELRDRAMSTYDYVKRTYQVNPRVGGRVTHLLTKRSGTIVREKPSQGHYVMVKFDERKFPSPCHPTELDYLPRSAAEKHEDHQ